ncbi:MAG: insulinase family protein [Pseudomonadales bacterium]|nr:insulinase family protein [Pseudomonadales bacterium]
MRSGFRRRCCPSCAFSAPVRVLGITLLVLLAFTGCSYRALEQADSAASSELVKSPNDSREYRSLVLANQLKVLLISDPGTDKAAAAVDVYAGSNSDPEDYPGLAHFLEHMLFLGTEKYPEAGAYQEYIAAHGGSNNAYTAYENTNYYFDIEKNSLAPALDRFSQFFIVPLFTPDYVDRERNAVHSEYQSGLQNDGRRAYEVFKAVLNPAHPLARFSVGSLETLRDKTAGSLRRALLDHYQAYYSANLMSLVVLGAEPLDELEVLARKYFSAVENRQVAVPATSEPLFTPGTLPALLQIKPVRQSRSLSYSFPIPVVKPYYRYKPLDFLANLLGHEGEGSLLSLLKEKGWANGLSAGGGMSYRDNATFSVSVALTEEGVNHVDDISRLLFQTIALIRRDGIKEWIFQEQKTMAELAFLFQEPTSPVNYASSLASALQEFPAAEVITAGYTYEAFDPVLIRRFLGYLRPDNLLLTLTEPGVATTRVEANFGAAYDFASLPVARPASWQTAMEGDAVERDSRLHIPAPNIFLPENIAIKARQGMATEDIYQKPRLLVDENGVRLWFRQDGIFKLPRANFYLTALTSRVNASVENSLKAAFFVNLVNDQLREYSYPANLAGLYYGVNSGSRGFSINLGGYDDKQPELLDAVLKTIGAADFTRERFDIIKAEMLRGLENADRQTPYVRLFQKVQEALISPYWNETEKMAALAAIDLDQVRAFVPQLLADIRIDALYHGNVTEEDARTMLALVTHYLRPSATVPLPPFGRVMKLPKEKKVIWDVEIEHTDSAIVMYQQGPDDSLATRATINLLAAVLRTPFYDTLRTERQLGYVVNAGTLPILKTNGSVMVIESPNTDPIALERHIDDFLRDYKQKLQAMPAADFAAIKAGLLNNLLQKPQRLNALSRRFWGDIQIGEYDADSTLMMAEAITALTKADIEKYYATHLADADAVRLVVRSTGSAHEEVFTAAREREVSPGVIYLDADNDLKDTAEFFYFDRP